MKKLLCAVFDLKQKVYCDPFVAIDENQTIGRFHFACAIDYESPLFQFCEDYNLYIIGTFDDVTGAIELKEKQIASGKGYAKLRDVNREKYYARKIQLTEERENEISNDASV